MNDEDIKKHCIILFDGVCNLCNGSVIFVLRYERNSEFLFASIQSEAGQKLLSWCGFPSGYNQAVIYIDKGKFFSGSTAALKIGQKLKFPWSVLSSMGLAVPVLVRDRIYAQIATHRYQWFGKRDTCMVAAGNLRTRFL